MRQNSFNAMQKTFTIEQKLTEFLATLAARLDGNVCWLVHHFGPDGNISANTGWIAMKFCIHGPLRDFVFSAN